MRKRKKSYWKKNWERKEREWRINEIKERINGRELNGEERMKR